MAKVEFKNVSKVYHDSKDDRKILSLKDISFLVNPGEIMVLIGPSGCGKTTILNLIAGFIQPTEGKVLFNGRPVTGPGAERTIIFQEYILFPWYSVRNNIEFGMVAKKVPKQQRRRISDELLSLVGLERFADFYPHQLSGGMKQRVALARALAVNPEVLLMD
ncbi:MAG: ATP-binding cassette domain-containing protein, partial [Candidatus Omnitrophota bacterium]